jgi:hypothetical protein
MKKEYKKPELNRQGSVEEITQKRLGYRDAFMLCGTCSHGNYIGNAS